jgi:tRNA(Ile)-lysidine synthase TilS/MesJ
MKICNTCVLPDTFPTIDFDDLGVCNYCRSFRGEEHQEELKKRYREKLERLLATHRGRGDYDVLMAYSGGKDSTYTLDLFKNFFKLRVLALTFDHGFVSPYAINNITKVIENLGVDHILFKPNFEIMKKVFVISVKENIYSPKTLERASTICTSCMNLVKFITLKITLEKGIPFIGYGWSPGQAPIQSAVMKNNTEFIKATQKALFDPLYEKLGKEIKPYFLGSAFSEHRDRFPHNLHPLAIFDYNEEKIYGRIKELGWEPPEDTDPNSTNCLMNAFANQVHQEQYKFHPYAFEIAGLVRMGVLSRQEGLNRLAQPGDPLLIGRVKEKLGI